MRREVTPNDLLYFGFVLLFTRAEADDEGPAGDEPSCSLANEFKKTPVSGDSAVEDRV